MLERGCRSGAGRVPPGAQNELKEEEYNAGTSGCRSYAVQRLHEGCFVAALKRCVSTLEFPFPFLLIHITSLRSGFRPSHTKE